VAVHALILIAAGMLAGPSALAADTPPPTETRDTKIESTTVEAARDREIVGQRVRAFVNAIVVKPGEESMARWEPQIPLCPLVAGMQGTDGEYFLTRISKVAAASGAPLAPKNCKGNLFVVVTSDPEGVIKSWSKRDVRMFGDETDQGGSKIQQFNSSSSVHVWHVWYNTEFFNLDGTPLGNIEGRTNQSARATRIEGNNYRALSSIMVIVDARRLKGVSFGQVAAYAAMVGLVQLHPEANVGDAPSILSLLADPGKAPPGLTAWDESFLKATYRTRSTDKAQIAAIKTAMLDDVAP
jgi:hypothetical protein